MKNKLNVGIVGFGRAAREMHVPYLLASSQYQIMAVLERNSDAAALLIPNVITVRSIEALLAIAPLDVIIVTTPNETHFTYAEKALLAGKHVVVEKPFTNTINESAILITLAKKCKVVLSVYQNRRYVADFLTIKEILSKKLLGEILTFEAHYDRYRPDAKPNAWREAPKLGSGLLYDLGSHLIDQALVLFGLPTSIYADIQTQRPHAVTDDYFDIDLYYHQLKVTLKASMLVREPGATYVIHGTKGSFIKYGNDPQEAAIQQGILPTTTDWGKELEENYGTIHTEIGNQIIREKYPSIQGGFGLYYQNLFQTIVHNAPLCEKPEHGFNTIKLIELALLSHKKKTMIPCKGLMQTAY